MQYKVQIAQISPQTAKDLRGNDYLCNIKQVIT